MDGLDANGHPNFQPQYTTDLPPVAEAVMIGNTHDEFGSYGSPSFLTLLLLRLDTLHLGSLRRRLWRSGHK